MPTKETKGELMIMGETMMYSLFPIIIAYSTKILPPILFAGLSTLTASITLFIFLIFTKKVKTIADWPTIKYTLGITLFIIIIPSILIFTGSSKTSGINTTLLLQSEMIFTFIIFGLFSIEKITLQKIAGATLALIGTGFIVFNGKLGINIGDLMIIAGTLFYSIGNIFSKKALKVAEPSTILFIRSFLGGLVLIAISLLFENHAETSSKLAIYWPFIVASGIFIYHLSKLLWYEGIKLIDISKATIISSGGYPAFSILFAIILLKEIPTTHQLIGCIAIIAGILTLVLKTKKVEPVGAE